MKTLVQWIKDNPVEPKMYWKDAAEDSFRKFNTIGGRLGAEKVDVVSSHRSKSIFLPVVKFSETRSGVRIISRDNFYDIKVSVWCPRPCNHDLYGIVKGEERGILAVYCEGFAEEWVLPGFYKGTEKFTAAFGSWEKFHDFVNILDWYFREDSYKSLECPSSYAHDRRMSRYAAITGLPVLFHLGGTTSSFQFFEWPEPISPDIGKLRKLFTESPKIHATEYREGPTPYINLDFACGVPNPTDGWLETLNQLVKERREDETVERLGGYTGVEVTIEGMSPEIRARAESLGCLELLK